MSSSSGTFRTALILLACLSGCGNDLEIPLDVSDPGRDAAGLVDEAQDRAGSSSSDARDYAPHVLQAASELIVRAESAGDDGKARDLLGQADRCLRDAEMIAQTVIKDRTLEFPTDRSLGKLSISSWSEERWRFAGQAREKFTVGPAMMIGLEASADFGPEDLDLLIALPVGSLQNLTIGKSRLTTADLGRLRDFRGLRDLSFAGAGYTGEVVPHIVACPWLRLVNLIGNHVADADIALLVELPGLEALALDSTQLTGAAFEFVARMPQLKVLITRAFDPGDDGVAHLASLTELERLWLSGRNVTDQSVDVLAELESLKELVLLETSITFDGIKRLEAALPDCSVDAVHRLQEIPHAGQVDGHADTPVSVVPGDFDTPLPEDQEAPPTQEETAQEAPVEIDSTTTGESTASPPV